MPDPINASFDPSVCSIQNGDVGPEEIDAQASLSSAHPVSNSASSAPPVASAPPAPPSPAVGALVSRFSASTVAHPPPEPSLGHALLNCKTPIANYLLNFAAVAVSIPETMGGSLVATGKVTMAAAGVQSCIDQNEAQQVQDANRANASADCRAEGGVPLLGVDNSVVCAKP